MRSVPIDISNASSRLTVIYRQPKTWGLYIFSAGATVWLILFLRQLPHEFRQPKGAGDFASVFIFLAIVLITIFLVVFQFLGSTELEFSDTEMTIRRRVFGMASSRTLSLADIPEPYFVDEERRGRTKVPARMRIDLPGGQFDCCTRIRGDEVYEIVQRIREAFPDLAKRWGSGSHQHSKDITSLNLS